MLETILFGIIQGIFEWIPLSSEAIIILSTSIIQISSSPIEAALILHFGTILSILVYFRKYCIKIITLKDKKILKFLTISTIISLLIGFPIFLLLKDFTLGPNLLILMGISLLVTGYIRKNNKNIHIKSKYLPFISGILQGLSIIPGLSRSSSTIFGLSLGMKDPKKILTISYIMSVPVVLVSTIYLSINNLLLFKNFLPGIGIAFIIGLITLHIIFSIINKIDFFKFIIIFAILSFIGAGITIII